MDLVNSVTQNSNNKNVTMENQSPIYNDYNQVSDHNDSASSASAMAMQMQAPNSSSWLDNSSESGSAAASTTRAAPARAQLPDYLKAIGTDPRKFWPKKYRFTREKAPGLHQPLTIGQRNFYENNGYLIVDGCQPRKLLEAIKAEHDKSSTSGMANEFLVDKLVAKNGKLLQLVKCFCDERTMLMTHALVETFHRPPSSESQAPRQQLVRDWVYLPFRPIDKVVCAITAIEPVEDVILLVPGTHRVGQVTITSSSQMDSIAAAYETSQERSPATTTTRNGRNQKELFESWPENLSALVEKSQKGFKYVNLKAGQTLFYHPGLIHGFSDDLVNYEKRQLASIAYYAAADCEYVEMRRQKAATNDSSQWAGHLPVGLAHFRDRDPSDYNSWINRPRLLQELKASL